MSRGVTDEGHRILNFALSANISTLFRDLPFLDRIDAAHSAGFSALECWWPFDSAVPSTKEVDAFVEAVDSAQMSLTALNFYAGDMAGGERGILCWPDDRSVFAESTAVLVEIAHRTGCRVFNALYGQDLEGVAPTLQTETALDNLAFAVSAVAPIGGTVVLEPLTAGMNGAYPLLTAADALSIAEQVPQGGVRLLLDTFHLTNNAEDLAEILTLHGDQIGHVQVADAPGREQPGSGTIDFVSFFRGLAETPFRGHVGVEYVPSGPTDQSFGWIGTLQRALDDEHRK